MSWWIYFAVVVLNVEDEEKEAQYSIYIPVVGSAPYLETGQKTQPVPIFIVNLYVIKFCYHKVQRIHLT